MVCPNPFRERKREIDKEKDRKRQRKRVKAVFLPKGGTMALPNPVKLKFYVGSLINFEAWAKLAQQLVSVRAIGNTS